jgi:hypothetical protein
MNNELERTWQEAVMACLRYYPDICLEGLRKSTKTSVRISRLPAEILTRNFPNSKQEAESHLAGTVRPVFLNDYYHHYCSAQSICASYKNKKSKG